MIKTVSTLSVTDQDHTGFNPLDKAYDLAYQVLDLYQIGYIILYIVSMHDFWNFN